MLIFVFCVALLISYPRESPVSAGDYGCAALIWQKVDAIKSGEGRELEPLDYAGAILALKQLEAFAGQGYGLWNRWAANLIDFGFVVLEFIRSLTGYNTQIAYFGPAHARVHTVLGELFLTSSLWSLTRSQICDFSHFVPDSNADSLATAHGKLSTLRFLLRP
ncbi:MAG: hypothetical protein EKK29_08405 [Hyphomicrobiales bacterium]|nr:MAG: hypothetical protein EKK29_08405 [Hyphomicrobiales bacterium]